MTTRESAFESAIAAFPAAIQAELQEIMEQEAVIPSERVSSWLDHLATDIGNLMIWLLPVAAS